MSTMIRTIVLTAVLLAGLVVPGAAPAAAAIPPPCTVSKVGLAVVYDCRVPVYADRVGGSVSLNGGPGATAQYCSSSDYCVWAAAFGGTPTLTSAGLVAFVDVNGYPIVVIPSVAPKSGCAGVVVIAGSYEKPVLARGACVEDQIGGAFATP